MKHIHDSSHYNRSTYHLLRVYGLISIYCIYCLSCANSHLDSSHSSANPSDEMSTNNYQSHQEQSDFVAEIGDKQDGLIATFDPNWLMSDLFFEHSRSITAQTLQQFFETTPYGKRSWLADAEIDGVSAAKRIVQVSQSLSINPILLLARMQVEQSLISRVNPPSQHARDFAFGCGCYDYEACYERYRGLGQQLVCAGETLNKLYQQSQDQKGLWRAGKSKETLDRETVTPANHATAAFYAYTPWVLRGQGGNWLVWNIIKRFTRFFQEQGVLNQRLGYSYRNCSYRSGRAFIGDPCACDADCNFWSGDQQAFCHSAGFCSLSCEGTCPDLLGKASTFCIADHEAVDQGICVSQASDVNGNCADLPGTLDLDTKRYVGNSNADERNQTVCAPAD